MNIKTFGALAVVALLAACGDTPAMTTTAAHRPQQHKTSGAMAGSSTTSYSNYSDQAPTRTSTANGRHRRVVKSVSQFGMHNPSIESFIDEVKQANLAKTVKIDPAKAASSEQ